MSATSTIPPTTINSDIPFGISIPLNTPHAISVSLPIWNDYALLAADGTRVIDTSMDTGYPRFIVHATIKKLASIVEQNYALNGEQCMLFPTQRVAGQCLSFLQARFVNARSLDLLIDPAGEKVCAMDHGSETEKQRDSSSNAASVNISMVFFPSDALSIAHDFWQHTGLGVSSRWAEHRLCVLHKDTTRANESSPPPILQFPCHKDSNGHYLEELSGHNFPLASGASAKHVIRCRIAGALNHGNASKPTTAGINLALGGPISRGRAEVSDNDVFLFPTGMGAIWSMHQLALAVRPNAKSVCFGFPYTCTLKVLEAWGPGCHFFSGGDDADIDQLQAILERETARDANSAPVLALFTEFPSNPLLRSPNLYRLRVLADKHDFPIVIDETIGNFANVDVLPYADVVVSSLSKSFSGIGNVMGGSIVLNPHSRHYATLKAHLTSTFEDLYHDEDAIHLEYNSRNFQQRMHIVNLIAEALCDFLRSQSVAAGVPGAVIKDVFYPKYVTPEHYEQCRIKAGKTPDDITGGGFGGMFSLSFVSIEASHAFFNTLNCFKGPSWGMNSTLACPYTILAHFDEMEWAAEKGVEAGLVRISVGLENLETLMQLCKVALAAAHKVVLNTRGEV